MPKLNVSVVFRDGTETAWACSRAGYPPSRLPKATQVHARPNSGYCRLSPIVSYFNSITNNRRHYGVYKLSSKFITSTRSNWIQVRL